MIAVEPPPGHKLPTVNGYPTGTILASDGSEIKIPFGVSARIWFKLQASGWGTKGLSGYKASVYYNCPYPPCDCLFSVDSTFCAGDSTCFEGAECNTTTNVCKSASVTDDSTYVFNGLTYTKTITSSHPNHYWNIQLPSGSKSDPGDWVNSGTLMFFYPNACPGATNSYINFGSTEFKLGDGTPVTPFTKGVKITVY